MKIYITRDINSAFFVSELYEDAARMEAEGEITEEEWKEYNAAEAKYWEWQDKIEKLWERGRKK